MLELEKLKDHNSCYSFFNHYFFFRKAIKFYVLLNRFTFFNIFVLVIFHFHLPTVLNDSKGNFSLLRQFDSVADFLTFVSHIFCIFFANYIFAARLFVCFLGVIYNLLAQKSCENYFANWLYICWYTFHLGKTQKL